MTIKVIRFKKDIKLLACTLFTTSQSQFYHGKSLLIGQFQSGSSYLFEVRMTVDLS